MTDAWFAVWGLLRSAAWLVRDSVVYFFSRSQRYWLPCCTRLGVRDFKGLTNTMLCDRCSVEIHVDCRVVLGRDKWVCASCAYGDD